MPTGLSANLSTGAAGAPPAPPLAQTAPPSTAASDTTISSTSTPPAPWSARLAASAFAGDAAAHDRLRQIAAFNPKADPLLRLPDVHPARLPRHVAIIMDGNGRWAQQRGLPRALGHRQGAESVRAVMEECVRLGVECLTLYSFSMENWKRPADEVAALMMLYQQYMRSELDLMMREGIRFVQIGRREGLPAEVLALRDQTMAATASHRACTLCLAVNYGSRAEITDAARSLARRVADGQLTPEQIDEAALENELGTAGLPELDLVVRTAGELRLSNFLLWQASYAEICVTPTLWPDYSVEQFHATLREFAGRSRRFGGL